VVYTASPVAQCYSDQGTLPLSSAAGQFVNAQFGNQFSLGPEEAENFSIGLGFEIGSASFTVDYFNIRVDDRIAITDQQDFQGLLTQVALDNGVSLAGGTQTSQILNALNSAGILNIADFVGSEDLATFGFFANDFDTETQGVDVVANNLSDTRLLQLEENLPNLKGNVSFRHNEDNWRVLARANFHDSYTEAHLDSGGLIIDPGGEITFDVGSRFPTTAPFGFSGGQWYLRANYNF